LNNGFNGEADVFLTKEEAMVSCNAMMNLIEPRPGMFVRHPDPSMWYSNPVHFSRDQQSAVAIGLSFLGNKGAIKRMAKGHLKRFGLYPNFQLNKVGVDGKFRRVTGDIASPEHFGYYIRGLHLYPLYPLLLVGDLFMLLNSLIIVFMSLRSVNSMETSNDLNHICALLQAKHMMPTPISWLARKVYSLFRRNAGVEVGHRLPGFGPQTALDSYFHDNLPPTSNPPIDLLFKSFLEKQLK
jgi:hypothetical protein